MPTPEAQVQIEPTLLRVLAGSVENANASSSGATPAKNSSPLALLAFFDSGNFMLGKQCTAAAAVRFKDAPNKPAK